MLSFLVYTCAYSFVHLISFAILKAMNSFIIEINVGGSIFSTLRSTITRKILKPKTNDNKIEYYPNNYLDELLSGHNVAKYDEEGRLFIDEDPKNFQIILNYLRHVNSDRFDLDEIESNHKSLLKTAEYYKVYGLIDLIRSKRPLIDSNLISSKQMESDLIYSCGFKMTDEWTLIHRASVDGFNPDAFHEKCDKYQKLLIIMRSTNGNIFGGYSNQNWYNHNNAFQSENRPVLKNDLDAFIFSLINKYNTPFKTNCTSPDHAITCYQGSGPCFGNGDLSIYFFNKNSSIIGHCYRLKHSFGSDQETILAGSKEFILTEMEVFHKRN